MLTLEVSAVRRVGVPTLALTLALTLNLAGTAAAQAPAAPANPAAPASALDNYASAAATTIIAEQACPGVQVRAGQLTTLRLAARVNAGQEAILEEKLRTRATQVRQQLAADGRETWCAQALAAFGPAGSVAKGILATGAPIR
ncbi:hypothetical protein SAMN02799625_00828 [Methylobacterium sp. UNC300MFChir4.1]|jgi:hypothetical protein|nr:hypothetical protein [Methylobacterium sp. OT2]SEF55633.1 hypothetical protein SAMN04488144_102147 [Methylobacterium sp. 190mf]SEH33719.1 hypothetical protein SAMN02799636_01428 [Methylobacterium sp. 275MFSha3.1]SEN15303.1 hypothetical protein SAMN02799625_00828 [Methylobacterium sp. UNC300MFChir4.1]SFS31577.1 hypothetical protein SAMN04487845_101140 [Methylobacterium sp. yr668]